MANILQGLDIAAGAAGSVLLENQKKRELHQAELRNLQRYQNYQRFQEALQERKLLFERRQKIADRELRREQYLRDHQIRQGQLEIDAGKLREQQRANDQNALDSQRRLAHEDLNLMVNDIKLLQTQLKDIMDQPFPDKDQELKMRLALREARIAFVEKQRGYADLLGIIPTKMTHDERLKILEEHQAKLKEGISNFQATLEFNRRQKALGRVSLDELESEVVEQKPKTAIEKERERTKGDRTLGELVYDFLSRSPREKRERPQLPGYRGF